MPNQLRNSLASAFQTTIATGDNPGSYKNKHLKLQKLVSTQEVDKNLFESYL